jgi:lipoate-protein ligase A
VRRWLQEISYFDDVAPHAAALNMAVDEALLAAATGPILRVYRWERPAVSFGYFERWEPIRAAHPGRDAVRRWTGGGVVLHGRDFTYSLLVPRGCAEAALEPARAYAIIHGALRDALGKAGIAAEAAAFAREKISRQCFENPVLHDVLVNGRKVAGAAQRRTRQGFIHQGSVQNIELPAGFGERLAACLAAIVHPRAFDVAEHAKKLAAEKYGAARWLEKRA